MTGKARREGGREGEREAVAVDAAGESTTPKSRKGETCAK